ncbi:MAG: MlaD family protein, partial [Gemmatimonadales bacterium]
MDLHRKQEVTVGVLVLGGIALFLAGTMWLQGKSFGRGQSAIQVSFADAGTLKRGSAVRVSGVNLGSVEEIDFRGVGD